MVKRKSGNAIVKSKVLEPWMMTIRMLQEPAELWSYTLTTAQYERLVVYLDDLKSMITPKIKNKLKQSIAAVTTMILLDTYVPHFVRDFKSDVRQRSPSPEYNNIITKHVFLVKQAMDTIEGILNRYKSTDDIEPRIELFEHEPGANGVRLIFRPVYVYKTAQGHAMKENLKSYSFLGLNNIIALLIEEFKKVVNDNDDRTYSIRTHIRLCGSNKDERYLNNDIAEARTIGGGWNIRTTLGMSKNDKVSNDYDSDLTFSVFNITRKGLVDTDTLNRIYFSFMGSHKVKYDIDENSGIFGHICGLAFDITRRVDITGNGSGLCVYITLYQFVNKAILKRRKPSLTLEDDVKTWWVKEMKLALSKRNHNLNTSIVNDVSLETLLKYSSILDIYVVVVDKNGLILDMYTNNLKVHGTKICYILAENNHYSYISDSKAFFNDKLDNCKCNMKHIEYDGGCPCKRYCIECHSLVESIYEYKIHIGRDSLNGICECDEGRNVKYVGCCTTCFNKLSKDKLKQNIVQMQYIDSHELSKCLNCKQDISTKGVHICYVNNDNLSINTDRLVDDYRIFLVQVVEGEYNITSYMSNETLNVSNIEDLLGILNIISVWYKNRYDNINIHKKHNHAYHIVEDTKDILNKCNDMSTHPCVECFQDVFDFYDFMFESFDRIFALTKTMNSYIKTTPRIDLTTLDYTKFIDKPKMLRCAYIYYKKHSTDFSYNPKSDNSLLILTPHFKELNRNILTHILSNGIKPNNILSSISHGMFKLSYGGCNYVNTDILTSFKIEEFNEGFKTTDYNEGLHIFRKSINDDITFNKIDPLSALSLSSIVYKSMIKNYITNDEEYIAYMPKKLVESTLRYACYAPRNEIFNSYYECNDDEYICSIDISSQYPAVMSMDMLPSKYLRYEYFLNDECEIDYYKDDDGEDYINKLLSNNEVAFITCDITPPDCIDIPLIPYKNDHESSQTYPNHRMNNVTHYSSELIKAIELGYKVTNITHSIIFEGKCGMFKDCMVDRYKKKQSNKGTRTYQLYKKTLNMAWGKIAQSNTTLNTHYINCNTDEEYIQGLNKLELELNTIQSSRLITDDLRLKRGIYRIDRPDNAKIALVTTIDDNNKYSRSCHLSAAIMSCARLRLYEGLEIIEPVKLLYCDTDSIYYIKDKYEEVSIPDCNELNGMGDWNVEITNGIKFVAIAQKMYGVRHDDGNDTVKAAGDKDNIITFDNIEEALTVSLGGTYLHSPGVEMRTSVNNPLMRQMNTITYF